MKRVKASAGCINVEVPLPMAVMYPVAHNGEIAAADSPLIVISHGNGGSHLGYRTLADYLARHGFVVAMPEHPRNNRNNNELAGTAENLENRPRHLRRAIDWMFTSEQFGSRLRSNMVAIVGHSLGGFTALALAGGLPTAFGHETPDNQPRPISVEPDPRVKALVLLVPATAWFMNPGALRGVNVPILDRGTRLLDTAIPRRSGQSRSPRERVGRTPSRGRRRTFCFPQSVSASDAKPGVRSVTGPAWL